MPWCRISPVPKPATTEPLAETTPKAPSPRVRPTWATSPQQIVRNFTITSWHEYHNTDFIWWFYDYMTILWLPSGRVTSPNFVYCFYDDHLAENYKRYMIRQKGRLTNRKIEDVTHTNQRRESFRLDLGSFPTTPVDSEGNAWDPYCRKCG